MSMANARLQSSIIIQYREGPEVLREWPCQHRVGDKAFGSAYGLYSFTVLEAGIYPSKGLSSTSTLR